MTANDPNDRDPWAEIGQIRKSIDNVDSALIHILAERFKLTRSVGALKAEFNIPASTPDREIAQVARLRKLAEESGLDPDFAEAFITFLIENVIQNHLKMRD